MTTYYVATTGSDGNPGTLAQPFATLAHGASVLTAGDILYLRAGTHIQTGTVTVSASGTAGAPITVAGYPGDAMPVVTGDNDGDNVAEVPSSQWAALILLSGQYITLANLEVSYSAGRGVQSTGDHNTFSGCVVHHTWNEGIYLYAAYCLVENCTLYRAADINYCGGVGGSRGCNGTWPGGLSFGTTSDTVAPGTGHDNTIRGNYLYNISGEAILGMHCDNALIEDNVLADNWGCGIDLDQCAHTTIQRNLIYYTGDSNWWRYASGTLPPVGILISNEGTNSYPEVCHALTIVNNLIVGSGYQIDFWAGTYTGSALIDTTIAFNTLVEAQGTYGVGLQIDSPAPGASHSNTRIANNLVLQTGGTITSVGTGVGLTFDHNLWSRTPSAVCQGTGDVLANPLLVDPNHLRALGTVLASWYGLQAGSPARDVGVSLGDIDEDYEGIARPQGGGYDMGALEYLAENLTKAVAEALGVVTTPTLEMERSPRVAQTVGVSASALVTLLGGNTINLATTSAVGTTTNTWVAPSGVNYTIWRSETIAATASPVSYTTAPIVLPFYLYVLGTSPGTHLSNCNRTFDVTPTKLCVDSVRADGGLCRDWIAVKRNFNLSWKYLPTQSTDVADGGLGAAALEALVLANGALMLRVPGEGISYTEYTVLVVADSFQQTLTLQRSNRKKLWDVAVALREV